MNKVILHGNLNAYQNWEVISTTIRPFVGSFIYYYITLLWLEWYIYLFIDSYINFFSLEPKHKSGVARQRTKNYVEFAIICLWERALKLETYIPHFTTGSTEKGSWLQVWQIHIQLHMVIYLPDVFESKTLWRQHLSFWWQITFLDGIKSCGHLQWNRWATAGFHNNQSWLQKDCGTCGLIVRTCCDKQ